MLTCQGVGCANRTGKLTPLARTGSKLSHRGGGAGPSQHSKNGLMLVVRSPTVVFSERDGGRLVLFGSVARAQQTRSDTYDLQGSQLIFLFTMFMVKRLSFYTAWEQKKFFKISIMEMKPVHIRQPHASLRKHIAFLAVFKVIQFVNEFKYELLFCDFSLFQFNFEKYWSRPSAK